MMTKRVEYAMGAAEEGCKVMLVSVERTVTEISGHVVASLVSVEPSDVIMQRLPDEHRAAALAEYEAWMARIKDAGGSLGILAPRAGVDMLKLLDLGKDYDLIMVC